MCFFLFSSLTTSIILLGNTELLSACRLSFERGLGSYEEKRFVNLISNSNYHFIGSLFNDFIYKKIVLNLLYVD